MSLGRRVRLWGLLALMAWLACGGQSPSPPPLPTEPVAEQHYLRELSEAVNNLPHYTTGNPNAVRRGRPGDLIWATFGGSDRLCLNTGGGPGLTTTWKCVTVS